MEARRLEAGPWKDREEFSVWWHENVPAFNRLSVTDPDQWEEIAQAVEKFQKENPQ
jgi:hypothetical protein